MTDTKKNQSAATMDEIRDLLISFQTENRSQMEQILLRMENILITRQGAAPTKAKAKAKAKNTTTEKATSKDKKESVTYSNTMYWWVGMYALEDSIVKNMCSDEDFVNAKKTIDEVKDKPESYTTRRIVGIALWKVFSKPKKGELKTMFDNWKKEQAKTDAEDVEKENNTDDETEDKKEENVGDDE